MVNAESKQTILGKWNIKVSKAGASLAHLMGNRKKVGVVGMNIPVVSQNHRMF